MEKQKEISAKSTKNEIFEAYNELLNKISESKPVDRQAEKKKEGEKELVRAASQNSVEKIVKGLAEIKLDIGKALDTLEEKLITEYKKLTELEEAIGIERRNLEEIHEIKVNADGLAALLQAQKEKRLEFEMEMDAKKNAFETDMANKKGLWKKEQDDSDLLRKETQAKVKKEREREEEEYSYNLQLKRKKDNDIYETKKSDLEKELNEKRVKAEKEFSEREALLSSREKEFEDLQAQVVEFPKKLEKAIKDTEKSTMERLEFKYKHEAELATKEIEGERKLNQQIVSALEAKIKEQEQYISQLNQKADYAGKQVQNIAIKAIEGASAYRILNKPYEDSVKEQSKTQ